MFKISVRGINNAIFYYITQPEIRAELRGWGVVLGRIPCFFLRPSPKKAGFFVSPKRFLKKQIDKTAKYYILPTSTSAAMLCKMANSKVSLVWVFDL